MYNTEHYFKSDHIVIMLIEKYINKIKNKKNKNKQTTPPPKKKRHVQNLSKTVLYPKNCFITRN